MTILLALLIAQLPPNGAIVPPRTSALQEGEGAAARRGASPPPHEGTAAPPGTVAPPPGTVAPPPGTVAPPPRTVAPPPEIIDRPIAFDPERIALTLAYRRAHEDPEARDILIAPRMVVVHHTAFPTLEGSFRYFDLKRLEGGRKELARGGAVNVSAHFLIDRDGTTYRLMPETWMARHCIGLNHVAIGIENVGGTSSAPLTSAQVDANARLIRALASRHRVSHVIGHHEYRRMEAHPYFAERDPGYRTAKIDPGPRFMEELRRRIADLGLEGP